MQIKTQFNLEMDMSEELKDLIKDYLEAHGYDVSKADDEVSDWIRHKGIC